jgi:hypothetical protein
MGRREIGREGVERTEIAQDKVQWPAFVNAEMNFWVLKRQRIS